MNLVKGQAIRLSGTTIQLSTEGGIVGVALQGGQVSSKAVSLHADTEWCTANTIDLTKLASSAEKLKVMISDASTLSIECGSDDAVLNKSSTAYYWVAVEIYQHNGGWKLRFLDDAVSSTDKAADVMSMTTAELTEALAYRRSSSTQISQSASRLVNSSNGAEFRSNAAQAANTLKNEGLSLFNRLKGKVKTEAKRFKNQTFLDATVSAAAMVAYADGDASPQEEQKLLSFIQTTDELKVFDLTQVKSAFDSIVMQLRQDTIIGSGKAYAAIEKCANKDGNANEMAPVIIALAISVAASENGIDDDEKAVIRKIIQVLKADASLYSDYL